MRRPSRYGGGRTVVLCLLTLALLLAVPLGASAGSDEVANSVSRKVMSPFCPGLTLHDCPSDAAADLREEIAGWADDGMSEEQIIDRLEGEFGAGILATPPTEGSGLVAWLLPIVGLLAAISIGVLLARRWAKASTGAAGTSTGTVDPIERARLEAELREIRDQA